MTRIGLILLANTLLRAQFVPLDKLELHGLESANVQYKGSSALQLTEKAGNNVEALAIVDGARIHNGTIELDVAGSPAAGAPELARGFIGVAFRMQSGTKFECFYIRPTNARADDQLRRNHSTQYISAPDWPWERLRKETPGVYESYTDMVPGEWTHLRIVVSGTNASLFVGSARQPCLVIHGLKLGDSTGGLALWIGPGTEGYFRNLSITGDFVNQPR